MKYKYKLVAHLVSPELQDKEIATDEYIRDYERFSDVSNEEEFLMKYPIESNVVEEFDVDCDYVCDYLLNEDGDGIYLFQKI
ncbi:MAG: hypothetical protein SPF22_04485 [Candidatus Onthovivens sp.]|nr:hypothetical protein [Candidatus Onthovivens sp.]